MSPKVDHRLSPNLKETGTMRSKWVTEGRIALRTHSLVKLNFGLRTTSGTREIEVSAQELPF